jgi:hypothetical protein
MIRLEHGQARILEFADPAGSWIMIANGTKKFHNAMIDS